MAIYLGALASSLGNVTHIWKIPIWLSVLWLNNIYPILNIKWIEGTFFDFSQNTRIIGHPLKLSSRRIGAGEICLYPPCNTCVKLLAMNNGWGPKA